MLDTLIPRHENKIILHLNAIIKYADLVHICHYENMPIQNIVIFHGCKNDNFQMKNCDIFLIFAVNMDRGYTFIIEPPQSML